VLPNHLGLGRANTAIGKSALFSNTSGCCNTASGFQALSSNTEGYHNTANGNEALVLNTVGTNNTASGSLALTHNRDGSYNTASGAAALTSNTTGSYNTANGSGALQSNTSGLSNTASGVNALFLNKRGNNNIALGANAGKNLTIGNGNIYIGNTGPAGGGENNAIHIGQTQTRTFIAGIKGVAASGATVVVKANGQLGVVASSARYKTGIRNLTDASDRLGQLHPVSYQYKTEPGVTHFGLIAEEVDRVMPELVVRDEENRPETVQYHELIPLLLQQRNEQQARLDRQDEVIARLTAEVAELRRAAGLSSRQARR
jgi:hypothetical protein